MSKGEMASGQSRKRSKSARRERGEPEKKRSRHHHDDSDRDREREHRRSRSRSHSRSRSRSRSKSHRRTREDEHHHSRHERHRSRERTDAKEGRRHEEVKVAGLPSGWRAYKSSSGEVFYYNSATRARQWARPGETKGETAAATCTRAEKKKTPDESKDVRTLQDVPLDLDAETLARLAPAPLVMPRSLYAGVQFTEEERAALVQAGVEINGEETKPTAEVPAFAEPRKFMHCACVGCHSKVFDPRTAQFLGPLSCEKNPVRSVRPLPLPIFTLCP